MLSEKKEQMLSEKKAQWECCFYKNSTLKMKFSLFTRTVSMHQISFFPNKKLKKFQPGGTSAFPDAMHWEADTHPSLPSHPQKKKVSAYAHIIPKTCTTMDGRLS